MQTIASPRRAAPPVRSRPLCEFLEPWNRRVTRSASLVSKPLGPFERAGQLHVLPRYLFVGPRSGTAPLRIGIFAGIHGDEAGALTLQTILNHYRRFIAYAAGL